MAQKTENKQSYQVSTTLPADYWEALEDHRWSERKKMTEVVRTALDDYVAKHGIKIEGKEAPAQA